MIWILLLFFSPGEIEIERLVQAGHCEAPCVAVALLTTRQRCERAAAVAVQNYRDVGVVAPIETVCAGRALREGEESRNLYYAQPAWQEREHAVFLVAITTGAGT